jgi:hypothetical protein
MRHAEFVKTWRRSGIFAAVTIAALIIVALLDAQSWAQLATYDDQLNYYDPGIPNAGLPIGYSSASVSIGALDPPVSPTTGFGGGYVSGFRDYVLFTDNLNSNGIPGGVVVLSDGPDGSPQVTAVITDFDDLHTFNIGFDQVGVAQQNGRKSFDVGGVYWIYEDGGVRPDPDETAAKQTEAAVRALPIEPPSIRRGTGSRTILVPASQRSRIVPEYSKYAFGHQGTGVGIAYGYYEFGMFDRFRFDAEGGILGRSYSDTIASNWVTGPHLGFVGHKSFGPISLYGHALGIFGVNDGDVQQNNGMGEQLVPGALNRPLYARPAYSEHRAAIDGISPTGVLWAEASLQMTQHTSVKFAWTAAYVNNVLLAEDRVRYNLPDMGLVDVGEQDTFQQFFVCGIEMVR